MQHFWEQATERHGLTLSYTWTRWCCRPRAGREGPARGQYRRKRERRPLVGMLVHLDASTTVVAAASRCGTSSSRSTTPTAASSMRASSRRKARPRRSPRLCAVLTHTGASPSSTPTAAATSAARPAGGPPDDDARGAGEPGARGARHPPHPRRSPEARGRSERAFGTIQGRLPQELRVAASPTTRPPTPTAALRPRLQPPLHGPAGAARARVRARRRHRPAPRALGPARPHRAQRQHGAVRLAHLQLPPTAAAHYVAVPLSCTSSPTTPSASATSTACWHATRGGEGRGRDRGCVRTPHIRASRAATDALDGEA